MPYITGINDTLNPFNSNPTEGHSPTSATTPAGRLKQPRKLPKAACDQRQQADFTHPRGGFPRREKETDQLDGEQRHRARTACNEKIEHNARIFKVQQFGESPLQR